MILCLEDYRVILGKGEAVAVFFLQTNYLNHALRCMTLLEIQLMENTTFLLWTNFATNAMQQCMNSSAEYGYMHLDTKFNQCFTQGSKGQRQDLLLMFTLSSRVRRATG